MNKHREYNSVKFKNDELAKSKILAKELNISN